MPITRGSTPATALPTNEPSGSTPSSRAFSSDAITIAAREWLVGLGGHERGAAHRLRAACNEEVAVAGDYRMAGRHDGGEPRGAEAVHRHARDRIGQAGQERRHASDVAIVLAG